jgi:hypothetical protein
MEWKEIVSKELKRNVGKMYDQININQETETSFNVIEEIL